MKRKRWLALVAVLVISITLVPAALAVPPYYVRGDFNSWGTTDMLVETAPGSGVYTANVLIGTAGRQEYKDADAGWTEFWPISGNSWFYSATDNQAVNFFLDKNTYNDGWWPQSNILSTDALWPTSWTAVGDWQGWDNGDDATAMAEVAVGLYSLVYDIATPGTYAYKAVNTGTWDAIGNDGISVNAGNLSFVTTMPYQPVHFRVDPPAGRVRVDALDKVVINEFLPKGTEWAELYNSMAVSVTLTGWYLDDADCGAGTSTIGTVELGPGDYFVVNAGDAGDNFDLDNSGDVLVLCNGDDAEVDRVAYGDEGGAPLSSDSTARPSDGVDTNDFARDWNLDSTPTPGSANDAPAVMLGSSLILNEFDNYPVSGNDMVEIYNPTGSTVSLTGWYLSDGDAVAPIVTSVSVPPGGWLVLEETVDWTATMDFSSSDVGYLFQPDGVRVDQIGWAGEFEDDTFQRICDGDGPNDGYDWPSSGGGVTWFDLPATLGTTNTPGPVDMTVAKIGPASASAGDLIAYVVSYQATQPIPTTTFVITDFLPAEVDLIGYTAVPALTEISADPLAWDAGAHCGLPSGVITLTVQISTSVLPGTVITNEVTIAASGDVTPTNDTAVLTTTIVGMDISVAKTGPTGPVWPGDTVTYTVSFDRLGTDPALNVALTDTFPTDLTYVDHAVYPTMNCTPTLENLVCTTATLTQPGWLILTGTVAASPAMYVLTNTVEITASNDGTAGNNDAEYAHMLVLPIQEVQYVPDPAMDDASPYSGQEVWVEGVVIAGSNVFLSGSGGEIRYYIEDPAGGPWSGLYVYKGSSVPSVQEGDHVLLYGFLTEYQGVTELDISGSSSVQMILSSGNPLPPPEVLATVDYAPTSAATAEAYESVLIEFQGAVVTDDDLGFGEWAFDDGSGAAHADDWSSLLTYVPANGDLYAFIRGVGNYSFSEYKLVPRYDADVDLDYAVTFVYHDLEQVVPDGVTLHIAGNFNVWSTTATPMDGDGTDDVYTASIVLDDVPYDLEYKYIAGDSWDSGQGEILNTSNRQATVTESTILDEYRDISSGWAKLNGPSPITINLGDPTPIVTGETWFSDLPFGANQVLVAELGYGTDADLNTWTWSEATFSGRVGNNDAFGGTLTPAATGVYSFAIRFDGNWGTGNPNSTWYAGRPGRQSLQHRPGGRADGCGPRPDHRQNGGAQG